MRRPFFAAGSIASLTFLVLSLCVLTIATDASFFNLNSGFALLGTDKPAETLELPVGTCNAETPCVNGACCAGVRLPLL